MTAAPNDIRAALARIASADADSLADLLILEDARSDGAELDARTASLVRVAALIAVAVVFAITVVAAVFLPSRAPSDDIEIEMETEEPEMLAAERVAS